MIPLFSFINKKSFWWILLKIWNTTFCGAFYKSANRESLRVAAKYFYDLSIDSVILLRPALSSHRAAKLYIFKYSDPYYRTCWTRSNRASQLYHYFKGHIWSHIFHYLIFASNTESQSHVYWIVNPVTCLWVFFISCLNILYHNNWSEMC